MLSAITVCRAPVPPRGQRQRQGPASSGTFGSRTPATSGTAALAVGMDSGPPSSTSSWPSSALELSFSPELLESDVDVDSDSESCWSSTTYPWAKSTPTPGVHQTLYPPLVRPWPVEEGGSSLDGVTQPIYKAGYKRLVTSNLPSNALQGCYKVVMLKSLQACNAQASKSERFWRLHEI